ncbi:hypothetical protein L1987_13478 [Smallanthus sonchifolius]|uniref:Uncharacterized protein n=1 Tax=Smallanthus sonchifolius TaxID=185202 RepID=A0ACB9JH13_9ASTR|nr:hypothetical protein L1987_13478 [Smallanthus sonchifolius]
MYPKATTTIKEVLIGLASETPNPSSSPLKVHSRSNERVDVEEAVTTVGPSNDQEDSDNIFKTSTTTTHGEGVSLETPLTERNPRRQETTGDGDAEARPTAPSGSKDSTTVDEDSLKLNNLELTARVAMLEAEVSKLRHQALMHEAHQCPSTASPSLVSVGTQTDAYLFTDATKMGEKVPMEEDTEISDDNEEESTKDWKLVVRAIDEVLMDENNQDETSTSFSIIPEVAAIISHAAAPHFPLTSTQLEFDIILAWGYNGKTERFWIGREFSGYPESSQAQAAERRLSPNNLQITRSSLLNEEEVLSLKRLLYKLMVKDLDVLGWISNKCLDHTFLLRNGTSLTINTRNILQLPSNFLFKIFQLRANICNINSLESQAMMVTIKAHLEEEGPIPLEESVSTSNTDSNSDTPQVKATFVAFGTRSSLRDQLREIEGPEYQLNEDSDRPLSISQLANEAKAEIPTAQQSAVSVISEAIAEASNVNKGKGIMTEEDEERLQKEKKEKEERRRKREEEEMAEEMAHKQRHQERKAAILLRQQTIQLYAKQLDEMNVKIHAGSQVEEDEQLARQLQEQFAKEVEEENEKKRKEDAKFRITNSKLAKELREEWTEALISQGEDADYLEKLSNKEIYRAFMGQQGELAKKKKDEEKEKARQKSKRAIALNQRTHEERKVMIDFLK